MEFILVGLPFEIEINTFPALALAGGLFCLLALLLSFGRRLEPTLKLERLGVPISLIIGLGAVLIGPYGPSPLLPHSVTDVWIQLTTPLLTLVFATLMLGRPLPSPKGLWSPVAYQASLGLFLGIGQYFVGGLVVSYFLIPRLNVDPLMGCLIEVGFEGGHGAAAIMGDTFLDLGFSKGIDLGYAMATVGLLSSTVIGSTLVVIARSFGWLNPYDPNDTSSTGASDKSIDIASLFRDLAVNLGLAGIAVGIGIFLLEFLKLLSPIFGPMYSRIAENFPVFPLVLIGSLLVRYLLEVTEMTGVVSQLLQREIGSLATDLLIITATASLDLSILKEDWQVLAVLSLTGLTWNLFAMLLYARLILRNDWFERSITEFGNATGVAATGLLLLRLSDPLNLTKTLPTFSIKQLFLQPLLSGGLITVLAPFIVTEIGLKSWTSVCGILSLLLVSIPALIQFYFNKEFELIN